MADFQTYPQQLAADLKRGNATEHTHRPTLKALIEGLFPGVVATNEPKRIKAGAPDYVVSKGETPLGYIEAKDVGVSLDKTAKSEQLGRYRDALGNLILTDYLEFRWYVEGEHRLSATLATQNGHGLQMEPNGAQDLEMLLKGFMSVTAPTIKSPAALAKKMASLAQQIRFTILKAFNAEDTTDGKPDPLHDQYKAFKEVLLSDLTPAQFADMYAQTITYGMFAARTSPNFTPPFNRYKAAYDIPKTNPFLKNVFRQMMGPDLETSVDWIVDDLVNLLAHADIGAILKDFGTRTRTEDPVVHFYETFLAAYDPKMREARGVYYTPEPVVSYIVRSVDHILKKDFGLRDGLADTSKVRVVDPEQRKAKDRKTKDVHKVQILDPATGTATFLHAVIDQIHATVVGQTGGNKGMWSGYVKNHLLPRVHGFELLMAPYTVAHMKLGLQLAELGYDFASDERLKIYLTNALEEAHEFPSLPLFGQMIARESQEAGQVKQDAPVMVVLGNPPYSVDSKNKNIWIKNLIKEYKSGLRERKTNLDDDFIKFIRFAQWRVENTGYGVVALITNSTYIDGITHRKMRESLLETFDQIYILDLHGDSNKKEVAPDGSKDENVFDIQQGVSIGIFVKHNQGRGKTKVLHADLYGLRDKKYAALWNTDVSNTSWSEIEPKSERHYFVPQNATFKSEWESLTSLEGVMKNKSGFMTQRDNFVTDFDEAVLERRIDHYFTSELSGRALRETFGIKDYRNFNVDSYRKENVFDPELIEPCLFRPFDFRHIYYEKTLVQQASLDIMRQLIKPNFGLVFMRQVVQRNTGYSHFLATNKVTDHRVMTSNRGYANIAPLYLYPDDSSNDLFSQPTPNPGGRRPNLSPDFVADVAGRLGLEFVDDGKGDLERTFGPEDVFHYIYAVFHSPSYRERYAEFLKIDFPRVPLTSDLGLFRSLAAKGEVLVSLHLVERVGSVMTSYPVEGDNVVEKPTFKEDGGGSGRVYINTTQYFEGVPSEVWSFYVGGYQVLHKWLKDRKGRELSFDDLRHYGFIVSALFETIGTMREIDEAIEGAGGFPLRA